MFIEKDTPAGRGELLKLVSAALNRGEPFVFAAFPRDKRHIELLCDQPTAAELETLIEALLHVHERRVKEEMVADLFKKLFGGP